MNAFLDWAGEAEQAAIAEMCAAIFGVGRVFVLTNKAPGRVRVRGYSEDGARVDIPLKLIHEDEVRITAIGKTQ
jgi:hypothetical protein